MNIVLLFIIISGLIGYIVYLHIQISKNTVFLDTLLKAMRKIDNTLVLDDIFKFLRKLDVVQPMGNRVHEHLFDPHVLDFLFSDESKQRLFLHYTPQKDIAQKILNEGFIFSDSFHKTAENVFNDRIDLTYKHNFRKFYGNYIVIISISKETYDYFASKIKQTPSYQFLVEHILSKTIEENTFLLPNKFLKGYIDLETGEVIQNPNFDPYFKPNL